MTKVDHPSLSRDEPTNARTDSKIDLLDPPDVVNRKIRKAVAVPKVVEENGLLAFVEYVLLPAAALRGDREFRVERERDQLDPLVYTTISQMHDDYRNDVVCLMRPPALVCCNTNQFATVDAPTSETCSVQGPECHPGTNSSSLPSFKRMAGNSAESVPATGEEREESEGQGQPSPRTPGAENHGESY